MFNTTIVQPCLVCGEPVSISAARPQPPERHYRLLFTCTNVQCPACLATFDARSYADDLARYCGKSKPDSNNLSSGV